MARALFASRQKRVRFAHAIYCGEFETIRRAASSQTPSVNPTTARSLFSTTSTATSAPEVAARRIRPSPSRRETKGGATRLYPDASIFSQYRRGKHFARGYVRGWRLRRLGIGSGKWGDAVRFRVHADAAASDSSRRVANRPHVVGIRRHSKRRA